MKILFYSGHPDLPLHAKTGYGTHMREMIRAFEELGHEVHVFVQGWWYGREWNAVDCDSQIVERIRWQQTMKPWIPALLWETARDASLIFRDYRLERELDMHVQVLKPDVIYERNQLAMLSGVSVARRHRIHHILEVNSPQVTERIELSGKSLLTSLAGRRDRKALKLTNHIITVSKVLGTALGLPHLNPNWTVCPNAIRPGQEQVSSLILTRATVGLSEDAFVVGFIGSIFMWHGVDLIIDAVCELRKEGHNVKAMIVGDGQIANNLKDRADQLGESGAFTWTGTINHHDTWAYARLSDCLVMTKSNWYGSPIKLFEYALAQRPIIAPNTDPVSEVMVNGLHGLLISPNVEELKTCILTLMRDPSLSQSLSDSWLNRVIHNHTWKRNAQMALNIT